MKCKGIPSIICSSIMIILLNVCSGSLIASENDIDNKVDEVLSRMTLEEKVGQMTQISLEFISKGYPNTEVPLTLDPERMRKVIVDHHVGSILNVGTHAHTAERWQEIITELQNMAVTQSRLGIPIIYGIDAVHGANYTKDATLFPQSIAMAATWNKDLSRQEGEITAYEVRASGIPWNFNPVLGMGRQPLWPRLWETYGEDPYLASVMGYEYIKGLEGENNTISQNNKVAACMKHYLGYSFPLTGQDRTPAWIPERMLREYFIPPFQAAVDAGISTVMVNSSEINGVPVHSSPFYLKELLFDEMGFEGFVVSDWLDIHNLYQREKVAVDYRDAIKQAVMAGIDMSMVPLDLDFSTILIDLVKKGEVPISRIDEAVRRILKVKFRIGLFDNPYPDPSLLSKVGCEKFSQVNRQAAREAITLLENRDSLLPLNKNARILVTGPTADKLSVLNGGWTITWQGDQEKLYPQGKNTIFEALVHTFGKQNVDYIEYSGDNTTQIVNEAKDKNAVILCLGEQPYCETPGNIKDLSLEQDQIKLAKALYKTNVPVILILVEGRPRIIQEIESSARAILLAYLPGMEGGNAIAEVIAGDFNPCGKLPLTYPRYPNDLTLYDHKVSEDINEFCNYNPQWPFGYGLSYTTFEFSNLSLDKNIMHKGEELKISVTVKNTGKRRGMQVVQLYIGDRVASVTPSHKRLKKFSKIDLEPGESRQVTFLIQEKDLGFIGRDNKPIIEPGDFNVFIGDLQTSFTYK